MSYLQKTYVAKPSTIQQKWYLVDAEGQVLGRMATRIARILMGKHKPEYTPHIDTGDFIVVVNAERVRITGKKLEQNSYQRYSGYPSGLKIIPMAKMMENHPDRVIKYAVRRMLPKTKLGRQMLSKLKIYAGPDHPHEAQVPEPIKL